MLRPFCDICDNQITTKNRGIDPEQVELTMEIKGKVEFFPVKIERMQANFYICKHCLVDAVKAQLDDRPVCA